MPKTRSTYAPEFRRQMVELVRAGRDPADLAREFEPSAQAIRNRVAQADQQEGRRGARPVVADASLPVAEREESAWSALRQCLKPLTSGALISFRNRHDPVWGLRFMGANQAARPIAAVARVLGMLKAGYYAWVSRPPSARAEAAPLRRIRPVHAASRQTYGAPRVHAGLRASEEKHGRKRIARLVRGAGLVGASHRRGGSVTARRDKGSRPAPDPVNRDFTADRPDQLWVADITLALSANSQPAVQRWGANYEPAPGTNWRGHC